MVTLLIVLGLGGLFVGGELLVRFASRLARRLGISSLVIGLTVVAFGTSAPELAASLTAALRGSADIALGNVIGSNTANLGLILGLSALVTPLATRAPFLRRELPFMLLTGAALLPLLADGRLGRVEGLGLVTVLLIYLVVLLRGARRDAPPGKAFSSAGTTGGTTGRATGGERGGLGPLLLSLLGIAGGLVLLVGGAQALVAGAVIAAHALGVPETVIGLTLVAVGTSLPELAASLAAAFKREPDIVLGNIVGSNIFNVLAILGISGSVAPLAATAAFGLDLWIMLGFSLLVVPFLVTRLTLSRWEGGLLVVLYAAYTAWLFVR